MEYKGNNFIRHLDGLTCRRQSTSSSARSPLHPLHWFSWTRRRWLITSPQLTCVFLSQTTLQHAQAHSANTTLHPIDTSRFIGAISIQHDCQHDCPPQTLCPFSVGLVNLYTNCTSMDADVLAKSLVKFHQHASFCRTRAPDAQQGMLCNGGFPLCTHTNISPNTAHRPSGPVTELCAYLSASCLLITCRSPLSPTLPWRGWKHMPQRVLLSVTLSCTAAIPPDLLELDAETHHPKCLCSM